MSLRTGNVLLWTKPRETTAGVFANPVSAAFAIDLLVAALVACIWFYSEGRRLGMTDPGVLAATLAFGLAGTGGGSLEVRRSPAGRFGDYVQ